MTATTEAAARNSHWQHHIDHWQTSDLSGADYCREHGLIYHRFLYWRRKFDPAATEQPVQTDADAQTLSAFVAVQPPSSLTGFTEVSGDSDDLHLCLPNGLEIRNIYPNNLDNVRALLERL